ncbi:MAG: hypothetical protein WCJ30_06380 [Deltaproteobacteria bacterium]
MRLLRSEHVWVATCALVAGCAWDARPPYGADVSVDGPADIAVDVAADTTMDAAVDAAIDAPLADRILADSVVPMDTPVHPIDASRDARADVPAVSTCVTVAGPFTVEADTIVSSSNVTLNWGGSHIANTSGGLYGLFRFPVGANPFASVSPGMRARLVLHAALTEPECGGACPFTDGEIDAYPLVNPVFDEGTVTYARRSGGPDVAWDVSPSGAARDTARGIGTFASPATTLEIIFPESMIASLAPDVVGGKLSFITHAVGSALFTAFTRESAGLVAQLYVETCR